MQVDIMVLLQISLIILVLAIVVAVIQIIIILVDVRQVTKGVKNVLSTIKVFDFFFDGDEAKKTLKKIRKTLFDVIESAIKMVRKLLGGGK